MEWLLIGLWPLQTVHFFSKAMRGKIELGFWYCLPFWQSPLREEEAALIDKLPQPDGSEPVWKIRTSSLKKLEILGCFLLLFSMPDNFFPQKDGQDRLG